jgi:hypothetical protein
MNEIAITHVLIERIPGRHFKFWSKANALENAVLHRDKIFASQAIDIPVSLSSSLSDTLMKYRNIPPRPGDLIFAWKSMTNQKPVI